MNRQLFRYHPTIGYLFIPGLKARVEHEAGGYLIRTNQAGFRCDHELTASKSANTFRVLLFGDSYTAGDGVSNRFRYSDVLEQLLPGVEVANCGLSGTGTDQQYLIYREFAREVEHDLVVIAVLVENIRRVCARYRPYATPEGESLVLAKPYYSLEEDGSLTLHHNPVPADPVSPERLSPGEAEAVDRGGRFQWLRESVNRMGPEVKDRVQRWTRYQPLPAYNRPDHPSWLLMKAILEKWVAEVSVPVVIMPIPLYHHVEETASAKSYQARFRELHAPPRVVVHDPLPDFHRHPRAERSAFRFAGDCHPTPAAHRVLAESLCRCIEPFVKGEAA